MHVVRDHDGKALEVVGSLTDISEQKRSESQLQSREEYLRTIFRTAQEGIITSDLSSSIVSINPAAEHIFGYDEGELIGSRIEWLIPEGIEVKHDDHITRSMHSGGGQRAGLTRELIGHRRGGHEFPVDIAVDRIRHNDEDHFLSIVRDISKRKSNEERILKYSSEMEGMRTFNNRS